ITQNSGGIIFADTSATLRGTNINGSFSIAGGSASNMLLENGGYLSVLNGHQATSTTINSCGMMRVYSGGSAVDNTKNSGGAIVANTSAVLRGTNVKG
ncbi:autotransporter adhesin family protein, partial [Escherichia coli]|nr:autotransporter adhesin family protein [Escherichia coli]